MLDEDLQTMQAGLLDDSRVRLEIPVQLIRLERRRYRRVKDSRRIRLRPCEFSGISREEVPVVENLSTNGLYFLSDRDWYWQGMKLIVTVPNSNAAGDARYGGMVTRVEPRLNGRRGVAVHLLNRIKSDSDSAEAAGSALGRTKR